MTDGTTGFHVAPITEDDMNRVTSILKRAMDTMIGASQLAADVDMLRQTVSGLQADADRLRNQNNALDEALNHSRQMRDEQAATITTLNHNLKALEVVRDNAVYERDKLELANEQYYIDLELTRKERDDAQFEVLDLKDKLAAANALIDNMRTITKSVASLLAVSEPAKPEEAKPSPVEVGEAVAYSYPATHSPEPSPTPEAPSGPDSQDHWDPGYAYDHATGKYWRHGVTPYSNAKDNDPFA